jgi:hypothetical protein
MVSLVFVTFGDDAQTRASKWSRRERGGDQSEQPEQSLPPSLRCADSLTLLFRFFGVIRTRPRSLPRIGRVKAIRRVVGDHERRESASDGKVLGHDWLGRSPGDASPPVAGSVQ